MIQRIPFILRQMLYDLRSGLLLRPGLITAALAALATALGLLDDHPMVREFAIRHLPGAFTGEPGAAQTLLATIAGSMMTVVSIVYSILVMMLTLASMQFSPRVVAALLRDTRSQNTLGIFIGTFTYCLLVLRSVRADPPFVPVLSVTGALALALLCLGTLIYFIHHIGLNIQANHLVDRVATETEAVIDQLFPDVLQPGEIQQGDQALPTPPLDAVPVASLHSGYIQIIDRTALLSIAAQHRVSLYLQKGVGEFTIEQNPLLFVHPPERATALVVQACQGTFDIGPIRTMQDDVEFGVRQIVDIALKAISPAVNDPSTAATCIDHLGRLLCRLARRRIAPAVVRIAPDLPAQPTDSALEQEAHATTPPDAAKGEVVVFRRACFRTLLDLSLNQIRQYGRSDMAVALRLTRMLTEVASVVSAPDILSRILQHARLIEAEARRVHLPADCDELLIRLKSLEQHIEGEKPQTTHP